MTWYARIYDTETKEIRYESLGTTKKTEAEDLKNEKLRNGDFNAKSKAESITLGRAFELYIKNLEDRSVKRGSILSAQNVVECVKPIHGMALADVTKQDLLEAFIEGNRNVKAGTQNTRRTIIKSAFKYFVNVLELIPSNIAEVLPSRKNNRKERDFWTLEQIDRILDLAQTPDRRLLWSLMAFAGLRIHEALKVKNEDFREGFLHVVGKGDKPAKVPVSSRLSAELDRCGWKWDFSGFSRNSTSIRIAARKALPEGFQGAANNHRLRHSFASNLIRSGVGLKQVQKLMRHSSITTTMNIYSHLLDDDLTDSVEKMFK